jgi:hypothetical protein
MTRLETPSQVEDAHFGASLSMAAQALAGRQST